MGKLSAFVARKGKPSRVSLAVAAAACILFSVTRYADAAEEGAVHVAVSEKNSSKPITFARVAFYDCSAQTGYTDADGAVDFEHVPTGSCRVQVIKRGYASAVSRQFEVGTNETTAISVAMAPEALKTISSVVVKASHYVSATSLHEGNGQALLHNSLTDALPDLADVLGTSEGLSIDGHDASQTGYTLDGTPIATGGAGARLTGVNGDLFGAASASTSAANGSIAGNINFQTLQPSINPETDLAAGYSSDNSSNARIVERGSAGNVGFVVAHASRGKVFPLDGLTFPDASGLSYQHADTSYAIGNLVKVRAPFSLGNSLNVEYFASSGTADETCNLYSALLPCGYGPSNVDSERMSALTTTYDGHVGLTDFALSVFGNTVHAQTNDLHRMLNGLSFPSEAQSDVKFSGESFSVAAPSGEKHEISFTADDYRFSFDGTFANSLTSGKISSPQTTYKEAQAHDTFRAGKSVTITTSIGVVSARAQKNEEGSLGVEWRPTANDSLRAVYAGGQRQAAFDAPTTWSDPQSVVYNCAGGTALGSAPGSAQGVEDALSWQVEWRHKAQSNLGFARAYDQVEHGGLATTLVDAPEISRDSLPPNYFGLIEAFSRTAAACGARSSLTFPSALYFDTSVNDITRRYRGVVFGGSRAEGKAVQLAAFVGLESATLLNTTDPRINNPYSIFVPGAQLPNVPYSRWGLVGAYKSERAAWQALLDVQHVSANNANNLPNYTTVAAGVSFDTSHGTLTVVGTNLTNEFSGAFASSKYAVALPTRQGARFPTVAQPLMPRQLSLLYSVRLGDVRNHGSETTAMSAQAETPQTFTINLSRFPSRAPANPFYLGTDNPACTADQRRLLSGDFALLQSFADALGRINGKGNVPAMPPFKTITVTYTGVGTSFALEIEPKIAAIGIGLLTCPTVAGGDESDVRARHLYEPLHVPPDAMPLLFMPSVGLYLYVPPQSLVDAEHLSPLPKFSPVSPFAVMSTCGKSNKSIVEEITRDVKTSLASRSEATATYAWGIIVKHFTNPGFYLELNPDDPYLITTLRQCLPVSGSSRSGLVSAGADGQRLPSVNFSTRYGFYVAF